MFTSWRSLLQGLPAKELVGLPVQSPVGPLCGGWEKVSAFSSYPASPRSCCQNLSGVGRTIALLFNSVNSIAVIFTNIFPRTARRPGSVKGFRAMGGAWPNRGRKKTPASGAYVSDRALEEHRPPPHATDDGYFLLGGFICCEVLVLVLFAIEAAKAKAATWQAVQLLNAQLAGVAQCV